MPTGPRVRANNVYGIISDNPLTSIATTMNSSGLIMLPTVAAAHSIIVLDPKRMFGEPEIVLVTAHTIFATSATITRGQFGTTARSHPVNTSWAHVPITADYVEVVTSSTHPSDPYQGQIIFEFDTKDFKGWDGSTWSDLGGGGTSIIQQAAEPGAPVTDMLWLDTDEGAATGLSSILAYAEATANQNFTTLVDLTGLTINFTVPSGRRVRLSGRVYLSSTVSNDSVAAYISEGATNYQIADVHIVSTGRGYVCEFSTVETFSAGAHIINLRAERTLGSGTITSNASTTAPAYILAEDITGTLWPAGQSIGAGTIASEQWTDFIPTLTQSVTLTKTVTYARYIRVGRIVTAQVFMTITSAGTAGNPILVGLPPIPPVTADVGPSSAIGSFCYTDTGTVVYSGTGNFNNATTVAGQAHNQVAFIGQAPSFAAANTDIVSYVITYEAAS